MSRTTKAGETEVSTTNPVSELEQEIASILRLQLGERGQWYYVSDQGEQGPYSFVEAVERYHDMLDRTYQEKEAELSRIRTLLSDRQQLAQIIFAGFHAASVGYFTMTENDERTFKRVADKLRSYLLGEEE